RMTPAMLNRLESGTRRGRPPLLRMLAAALLVPASELLDRAGYEREAQYWRAQEGAPEATDPLVRFQYAVNALSLPPPVPLQLLTLVSELARDYEQEHRQRFDAAVARDREPTDADAARFALLRTLLFEPDGTLPTEQSESS